MKITNKIILFTFSILLIACKGDLLNLNPHGEVGSELMWTTENLADQGVNGVYNALRYSTVGHIFYQSNYSVDTDKRDPDDAILLNKASTGTGIFRNTWQQHYEGIHRANDAIVNLPSSPLTEEKKARLIAESKFLRAFFYYRLNALYKGVPLYLEPVQPSQANKPRETEAKIWEVVIQDLTDCINTAPLPNKYDKGDAGFGRITKGAAYALRGKTYLYLKEWAKAEADFKKVGECGYKLYQGDYKQLFKESNEQSDEMILSVQEIGLPGQGTELPLRYGGRNTFQQGWNTFLPNTDFVNSYTYADGKPFDWADLFPEWNQMKVNERAVFFYRNNLTESEKQHLTATQKVDFTHYLENGNEERLLQAYTNRDPRLTATIITPYSEYLGSISNNDVVVTLRWPYRIDTEDPHDLRTDTNNRFYYLYRKFVPEGTSEIPNRSYSPIDFPLIRYADVLLNLAEALNEQGKTTEAIECVNLVRARAGVAELNSNQFTQVLDQDDLRAKIQQERRWEFNGEAVTFYDELRWDTWKETKFFEGAGLKQIWGQTQYSYSWGGDELYQWPVPKVEKERNDNLEQSPGWVD